MDYALDFVQSMDGASKLEFRTQKEKLTAQQQESEAKLVRAHKNYLDLELRKYHRRRLLHQHKNDQDRLVEVNYTFSAC